jgi:hypothetical protein
MAMRRSGGFSGGFDRQQVENELFPSTFDAPEYKAPALSYNPTSTTDSLFSKYLGTSTFSKAAAPTSGLAVNRVGTAPTVDTTGGFSSSPKPKAPAPYADPAPATPQPKAPVASKIFTAPTPVTEVITDINTDSTVVEDVIPTLARTPRKDMEAKLAAAKNYNWNEATQYSSVTASQYGYAAEYADIVAQVADHSVLNNAGAYRNEARASDGRQALNPQAQEAAITRINNYLDKNNLPLSKEINGQTVYLTLGETGMQGAADAIYRTDSGITDDQGGRNDNLGKFVSHGEVGTYSTIYQPPVSDMDNPYVAVAAALIPGAGAMLSTIKGLSGETLHASDWGKIVTTGLELSGDLVAPTADMPDGQGFAIGDGYGLDYDQSVALLDTAAGGNPITGLMAGYGNGLIEDAIGSSEALQGSLDALGMSPDAFASAVSKAATKLAQGEDLDDSLISGLATYIKKGGGIGTPDLGLGDGGMFEGIREAGRAFDDAVLQPVKELVEGVAGSVVDGLQQIGGVVADAGRFVDKEVLQPTKGLIEDVAEDVVEVGSQINKDYVKPAIETIEDINEEYVEPIVKEVVETGSTANKVLVKPIIDTIETVGSEIDDELLQPIKDVVEEAASAAGDLGSEFDDAVLQPVKEFIEEVGGGIEDAAKAGGRVFDDYILQPLKDLLEGILGNINLSGLGGAGVAGGAGLALGGGESSNALAENSPFKFKTEIGLTDLGADIVPQQLDIADLTTSPFESEFAQPQRFII